MIWLAAIAASASTPLAPTDAEWASLEKGDVVTRAAPDLDPPGAYAWVVVKADDDDIWAVLHDSIESVKASGAVTACEAYLDETAADGSRRIGLHYTLNVAMTEVQYSVLRHYRPELRTMTWTLDPSRPSDLAHTSGSYVLSEGRAPDTWLLAYVGQVDSGRRIPAWIQQLLTGRSLRGYLEHVKRAAEAR